MSQLSLIEDGAVDMHDPVLFGADGTERIVALEAAERYLVVWRRLADGRIERTTEPFRPWLLLTTTIGESVSLGGPSRRYEASCDGESSATDPFEVDRLPDDPVGDAAATAAAEAPGYCGAPTPGDQAPGCGGAAPTPWAEAPGYCGAPTPGDQAPGCGGAAPTPWAEAPGYCGAPTPGDQAPGCGGAAPTPGAEAPGCGGAAPTPGAEAPGCGGAAPTPGAEAPGYCGDKEEAPPGLDSRGARLGVPHSLFAAARLTELVGEGFRYLYEFASWAECQAAISWLRDRHVEYLAYPSGVKQGLVRTGKTLFKGMTMQEVVRMQVDLETETLAADAADSRILVIAVRDNRGLLETLAGEEEDILRRFVELVRQRDPDILEGHNLYGFDLPYLQARAQAQGIRLAIGRDGSEMRFGRARNFAIGGITRPFTPAYVYGRHVLDTYLAVQRFDWSRGVLSSYGLKEVARAFGIAEPDRVEMPRDQLAQIYRDDPDRVLTYCCHDVTETARLAELVAPTEFYLAQMVPDSYGAAAVAGTGEKINSLMVRAYLARGHAVPRPQPTRPYAGGYTDIRATGVIDLVVKADVESLYPSLMLAHRIKPASDTLDLFLPALAELTRRRLEAKAHVAGSSGPERHYWDGLQSSFKVLINSFYGYLGAGGFNFNDCEAAGRITELGRELVVDIADRLERAGSRVIEIDTDGVYFVPPDTVQGEEAERACVAEVGGALPAGIRLAFDGRYRAMLSLKTKNYVLQGYDGKVTYKGASLRSRADEPYGREFLAAAVALLLDHLPEEVGDLYRRTIDDIVERRIPIRKLARRERVTEKTFTSSSKARSLELARDLPVGEYMTVYERANGSLGLLEEYEANGRDERVAYYADKLHKFAARLREAFTEDFDTLVPAPGPDGRIPPTQHTLDLF